MRLRSWRGSTPLSPSTRRPFPWARIIIFLVIAGIAAYIFVPPYYTVKADALVQADLVPVAPMYRVRVDRLLVHCDQRVTAGQQVAVVSNFMVQADYQRQYLQSTAQEQISEIDLSQQVATARANAESMHQKYVSAQLDAKQLYDTFKSYDDAYQQGAVSKVEWQDKHTAWQSAAALEAAALEAWHRSQQEVQRISADRDQQVASAHEIAAQAAGLADRTGSEPLVAPVSGYIVGCVDRPQNVIEPSTPLFHIFEPQRAYVLAYFTPQNVGKVHIDQTVSVTVAGIPHTLNGRIESIYPDLHKLPPQLTRFFWQHVQWSQYRPVRISLAGLTQKEREELYYGAQAHVSISVHEYPQFAQSILKRV
jgi:multidrug resistance efflux pump